MKTLALRLSLASSLLAAAIAASAQSSWNVASDFSATANPHNQWTYGQASKTNFASFLTYSKTFTLLGMNGWSTVASENNPNVIYNGTGSDVVSNTITYHAGEFTLIPGPNKNGSLLSIARWTAPATGSYQYSSLFSRLSPQGLASAGVSVAGAAPSYAPVDSSGVQSSGLVSLTAGQTIEFIVESTALTSYDTTGLSAQIQAVPEPTTVAALGLGALGLLRRRRKA